MPVPVRIRKTSEGYTFPATNGCRVLVCAEALELVRELSWYADYNSRGTPYIHSKCNAANLTVIRRRLPEKGPTSTFTIQCWLKPPGPGLVVHHRNANTLDNRLENLVVTTQTLNNAAQGARGGTSKYKGVHLRGRKWIASIQVSGQKYQLGSFDDEVEAALRYDLAAMQHFGELAALNFPAANIESTSYAIAAE